MYTCVYYPYWAHFMNAFNTFNQALLGGVCWRRGTGYVWLAWVAKHIQKSPDIVCGMMLESW